MAMEENRKQGTLYIVVPCYNEEEALLPSAGILLEKLRGLMEQGVVSEKSRIVFVDDGSRDKTWELISRLYRENKEITGLRFANNRGH